MKRILSLVAVLAASAALAYGPNSASGSLTVQNANGNSGACTSASCVQQSISAGINGTIFTPADAKYGMESIQVTGTWSGTLTFQWSQDEGSTWSNLTVYPAPFTTTSTGVTSTTANGNWVVNTSGFTTLRVVMSSYTSGTAAVVMEAYTSPNVVSLGVPEDPAGRPVSGNSTRASYDASVAITLPTSAGSLMAVESSSSNVTRLRRLRICNATGVQTTAGYRTLALFRTTAASSGGSTQTPVAQDPADAAFGGVVRAGAITTTPASPSLVANALWSGVIWVPTAVGQLNVPCIEIPADIIQGKAPEAASGTANGLGLADLTGGAGGSGTYVVDLTFTSEAN